MRLMSEAANFLEQLMMCKHSSVSSHVLSVTNLNVLRAQLVDVLNDRQCTQPNSDTRLCNEQSRQK